MTHSTPRNGLNIENASPTMPSRPPRPPYSSAMSADSSSAGQSWRHCQMRLGTQSSTA